MIPEYERLAREDAERKKTESTATEKTDNSWFKWRDLISSIKIDVNDVSFANFKLCIAVLLPMLVAGSRL